MKNVVVQKLILGVLLGSGISVAACSSDSSDPAAGGDGGTTTDGASTTTDGAGTTSAACGESFPAGAGGATVKTDAEAAGLKAGDYSLDTTCGGCGFAPQRNGDEYFANFGKTVDATTNQALSLRFGGFNRTGTFKCGDKAKPDDDYALQTTLELWISGGTTGGLTQYRGSETGASCSVTVTKIAATGVEGCYTGSLVANGKTLAVSGAFRSNAN